MEQGVEHAWELLAACDPADVARRAAVKYQAGDQCYRIPVLGQEITVDIGSQTLTGASAESQLILNKLAYFSRLAILHYLLGAQEIAPSGRLVKPEELKSGQIYREGSHVLPLQQLAGRFADDPQGFLAQAHRFGGEARSYGDVAVELRALPRVPLTLLLWCRDEEFPARSLLLFDDTCEQQLPADMLWAVAMLGVLVMLR